MSNLAANDARFDIAHYRPVLESNKPFRLIERWRAARQREPQCRSAKRTLYTYISVYHCGLMDACHAMRAAMCVFAAKMLRRARSIRLYYGTSAAPTRPRPLAFGSPSLRAGLRSLNPPRRTRQSGVCGPVHNWRRVQRLSDDGGKYGRSFPQ
jgi:hypothetical protein